MSSTVIGIIIIVIAIIILAIGVGLGIWFMNKYNNTVPQKTSYKTYAYISYGVGIGLGVIGLVIGGFLMFKGMSHHPAAGAIANPPVLSVQPAVQLAVP